MRNLGIIIGILVLVFGLTIFTQALSFDLYSDIGPGPGLFPILLSSSLIILSIFYIIDSIRKNPIYISDVIPKNLTLWKVLRIILAILIFIIFSPLLGFTITGFAILCLLFYGSMRWYKLSIVSALLSITVFTIFKTLLSVPLPVNTFGW